MPLNAAFVGKRYPPSTYLLDAERVTAFAEAVGHRGDGVPPTFVTVPEYSAGLANVVGDSELGLDFSRVLHAEQEYEWGRALTVGETLTAQTSIEDIRSKGGLEILTLRTELRDETTRVVVAGRTTLIVRGAT